MPILWVQNWFTISDVQLPVLYFRNIGPREILAQKSQRRQTRWLQSVQIPVELGVEAEITWLVIVAKPDPILAAVGSKHCLIICKSGVEPGWDVSRTLRNLQVYWLLFMTQFYFLPTIGQEGNASSRNCRFCYIFAQHLLSILN